MVRLILYLTFFSLALQIAAVCRAQVLPDYKFDAILDGRISPDSLQTMTNAQSYRLLNKWGNKHAIILLNLWDYNRKQAANLVKCNSKVLILGFGGPHRQYGMHESAGWILAGFQGDTLWLPFLDKVQAGTLKAIATFKGKSLGIGLTSLSVQAASDLAGFAGAELLLWRFVAISPASAKELARFQGKKLCLWNVKTLSDESAKYLAEFDGQVEFSEDIDTASFRLYETYRKTRLEGSESSE